jgi:anti-sigma B factor antagonist
LGEIQWAIYTGEIHMSMNANVLRDALGNITIQMSGDLDYENSMPLRRELNELSTENPHSKITVDLGGVDFVGSSGICHFVETIQIINKDKHESSKVSLSNVSTDFRKVFKLYTAEEAELIWDEMDMDSDDTSNMNSSFGNRKRTFQN